MSNGSPGPRPYARARLQRLEATPDVVDRWVQHVNDAANATLLSQAKHSWYLGANVPGKPRVFMPYAGGMARYREICAGNRATDTRGLPLSV